MTLPIPKRGVEAITSTPDCTTRKTNIRAVAGRRNKGPTWLRGVTLVITVTSLVFTAHAVDTVSATERHTSVSGGSSFDSCDAGGSTAAVTEAGRVIANAHPAARPAAVASRDGRKLGGSQPQPIGVWWRLEGMIGWGVYGANLVSQLEKRHNHTLELVLMVEPMTGGDGPVNAGLARQIWERSRTTHVEALSECLGRREQRLRQKQSRHDVTHVMRCEVGYPVLHAFGNYLAPDGGDDEWPPVWGTRNALVVFFERQTLPPSVIARLSMYDVVITGSSWNAEALRAAGLPRVARVWQGVDGGVFDHATVLQRIARRQGSLSGVVSDGMREVAHQNTNNNNNNNSNNNNNHKIADNRVSPGVSRFKPEGVLTLPSVRKRCRALKSKDCPLPVNLRGRFIIFSGGKLEFRKGQDTVVAAFRIFRSRHPEANAFLLTAWHNMWPGSIGPMDLVGHVSGRPEGGGRGHGNELRVSEWLAVNGIDRNDAADVGPVSAAEMAEAMAHADAGVFVSRAESGTNLVAMEAMSMGLPVVVSNSTGHADIVRDGAHCYAVSQTRLRSFDGLSTGMADDDPRAPAANEFLASIRGFGDSDPLDVVALLEMIYDDPREARRRGRLAADLMRREFPWEKTADNLVDALRLHGALS